MHVDNLKKELRDRKYRMTPQREQVLKVFIETNSEHLGAEEVYRYLVSKKLNVSKATVYRTIDLLVELGFLRRLQFDEGVYRYELVDREGKHSHFICNSCGMIYELKGELSPDNVMKSYIDFLKSKGYLVDEIDLKFRGICPKCAKGIKKSKK
ncbi:Fur family transcriptional regulator, ferric uptake regulator [Fervidobacterium changbaicum]|uniref:Transcriptional repressor n=2 Tax=Fervidobacterium TaxID=2422 RepID=A0AAI8CJM7_FERIS|nr:MULTISPECIES: Fur family transcriptional regulator [Fervidobacterium]AMW32632.1 transcriptional repressor [Fervidobacterium islandicum]QAV32514.1 transcriptional repressor [Fervidobacterium changbaicum]SDH50799.1 Fur family transcriptional regulator, ferric uptake regulator [Fervidobacterium changbaicum]